MICLGVPGGEGSRKAYLWPGVKKGESKSLWFKVI